MVEDGEVLLLDQWLLRMMGFPPCSVWLAG